METRSGLELQQILEQDDLDACLRFFSQATEAERRALSGIALAAMPTQCPLVSPFRESPVVAGPRDRRAGLVLFRRVETAGVAVAARLGPRVRRTGRARPDWIDEFAEAILDFSTGWWGHVRRLVREGLCRKPRTEKYVIGMLDYSRYRRSAGDQDAA